jgi:hypothetical protein
VRWVSADVFILTPTLHVGDDAPLTGLARLGHGKQGRIRFHLTFVGYQFEHTD